MKELYRIGATATGGRNGHVKSENGVLDIEVRVPKAMGGGSDDYANPEMLFAAGYAACFDSAMNYLIKQDKISAGETSVEAIVGIGQIEGGGFALTAELKVNIPGLSIEEAQAIVEKAHATCPYSNATRNNIEVKLTVTNND